MFLRVSPRVACALCGVLRGKILHFYAYDTDYYSLGVCCLEREKAVEVSCNKRPGLPLRRGPLPRRRSQVPVGQGWVTPLRTPPGEGRVTSHGPWLEQAGRLGEADTCGASQCTGDPGETLLVGGAAHTLQGLCAPVGGLDWTRLRSK